jgi:hypothetical protein
MNFFVIFSAKFLPAPVAYPWTFLLNGANAALVDVEVFLQFLANFCPISLTFAGIFGDFWPKFAGFGVLECCQCDGRSPALYCSGAEKIFFFF